MSLWGTGWGNVLSRTTPSTKRVLRMEHYCKYPWHYVVRNKPFSVVRIGKETGPNRTVAFKSCVPDGP